MIELTDEMLIERIKIGDDEAFEYLLRRYKILIDKIVRNYYLPSYETEDFGQIASMAFHRAVLTYERQDNASFYAYALSCVRNKLVSLYRHELLKTEYIAEIQEMTVVMDSRESYYVEKTNALEAEKEASLERNRRKLVDKISKKYLLGTVEQQCLEALLDGLTYSEISEAYGFDRVKISNAMARVRVKFKKYGLIE